MPHRTWRLRFRRGSIVYFPQHITDPPQRPCRFAPAREDEDSAMNFEELYHFLFETMPGIGILVGGGLVISIIVCLILERKTRKQYKNHEKTEDDWSLFDDDDEDEGK